MHRFSAAILPAACVIAFSYPSAAIEEWESNDGEVSFSLVGAERVSGAFFHAPDLPNIYPDGDDAFAASVTRLILDGSIREHLKLEVNVFLDIARQPFLSASGAFSTAGSFDSVYRTRYLVGDFWESGSLNGRGGVDRLALTATVKKFTITVGRTPANYAVTQIFTPNDFFAPFSTTAVNTIYKPGVDNITVSAAPGMLSTIQLTGVLGADEDGVPTWGNSALLLHARNVYDETELALFAGKLAKRWVTGASMQAPCGPINLRAEGHVGFPDAKGDFSMDDLDHSGSTKNDIYTRFAVGIDSFFTWHNSTVGAEYMYLSDGASSPERYLERATRFFPDDQLYLGRHYLGITASTEALPVLKVALMGLLNLEDASGTAVATLLYSIADEADFVGGLIVPFGKRQSPEAAASEPFAPKSEFGQNPFSLFLESRFYF